MFGLNNTLRKVIKCMAQCTVLIFSALIITGVFPIFWNTNCIVLCFKVEKIVCKLSGKCSLLVILCPDIIHFSTGLLLIVKNQTFCPSVFIHWPLSVYLDLLSFHNAISTSLYYIDLLFFVTCPIHIGRGWTNFRVKLKRCTSPTDELFVIKASTFINHCYF